MSADSTRPADVALKGVALRDAIQTARQRNWPTLADGEYIRVLILMDQRFPGVEVLALRFCSGWNVSVAETLVDFRGGTEALLGYGLVHIHEVPVLPKRLYSTGWESVRRGAAGKMLVGRRIRDHAADAVGLPACDPGHPLAFLRPSQLDVYRKPAVTALAPQLLGTTVQRPYLRLVVDNTGPEVRS
jgi:hypothetical protein